MRYDLGLRALWPQWRQLFTRFGLKEDILAGIVVGSVAIPLSLAIALASGVSPAIGLVTAIVASVVCALFGGTPLAVSGPAAAMAVLVAGTVQQFGMSGLLFVTFGCGILQLVTGFLGLGRFVRFVPMPVVAGFTAGIGVIIFVGQLPRLLGLPAPAESHVLDVLLHIGRLSHMIHWGAFSLAMSTLVIVFLVPRILPRFPAPLLAVLIPSLVAAFWHLPVDTIGTIPSSLPLPHFPALPQMAWGTLLGSVVVVYLLASLETLLSATAVDKLSGQKPHDSDQELTGQGLGNMASALFGGIPVTSVIARSALNIQAGAKTRRAAIIHAVFLLMVIYWLAPWMSRIPLAVLAGILVSVALRMAHPREFLQLWRTSREEGLIYLITFSVMVCLDLLWGIQAGIVAALIIAGLRLGQVKTQVHLDFSGPAQVCFEGALTFLSVGKLNQVARKISGLSVERSVVVDLSQVQSMDASGAEQFLKFLQQLGADNRKVALKGVASTVRQTLLAIEGSEWVEALIAADEAELFAILHETPSESVFERLVYGIENFKKHHKKTYHALFERLAQEGQTPHTLFITCSDSRINPNLMTSTDPGELFVVRNVGNVIPVYQDKVAYSESAALEFAVSVLGVREIVLCAHSECGAMKHCLATHASGTTEAGYPHLTHWLAHVDAMREHLRKDSTPEHAAKLNALLQLENLKTYPFIQQKLRLGELKLRAWYYDIGQTELEAWDDDKKMYVVIGSKTIRGLERRTESGVQYQAPLLG